MKAQNNLPALEKRVWRVLTNKKASHRTKARVLKELKSICPVRAEQLKNMASG